MDGFTLHTTEGSMRQIQLTIALKRCQSDKSALESAQAAGEWLMETFNDDNSLATIHYKVLAQSKKKVKT